MKRIPGHRYGLSRRRIYETSSGHEVGIVDEYVVFFADGCLRYYREDSWTFVCTPEYLRHYELEGPHP